MLRSTSLLLGLALCTAAVAATPETSDLPRSDPARVIARAVLTPVRDGVISSGVFGFATKGLRGNAARLSDEVLVDLNRALTRELALDFSMTHLPRGFKLDSRVRTLTETSVRDAGKVLAEEVNDYDPKAKEHLKLARALWVVLNRMGAKEDEFKVLESRGVYNDEDPDSVRHVTVSTFLNLKSGKMLVLYMVEGSI